MKKPTNTTSSTNTIEEIKVESFKVLRAILTKNNTVLFDLELNGVRVYGLSVVEGKNGDFISFPQRKGGDGKYYSVAWAKLSDKDTKDIIDAVEVTLNA